MQLPARPAPRPRPKTRVSNVTTGAAASTAFKAAPKPAAPAAPAARPVDAIKNPAPWTPTLDATGIADDADLTNRYNQDKTGLDTQWGDQVNSLNRQYTTAAESYAQRNKDIATNAASRGLGRSGIRQANDLESGLSYGRQVNDIDTARTTGETTYKNALKNLATNYQTGQARNLAVSGQRSLDSYNASTAGGYDAQVPANAPGTGIKMNWAQFKAKHPSAKTPAQIAALRQKYDRWVARG